MKFPPFPSKSMNTHVQLIHPSIHPSNNFDSPAACTSFWPHEKYSKAVPGPFVWKTFANIHLFLRCTVCRRTPVLLLSLSSLGERVISALRFPSLLFSPWQDGVCMHACALAEGAGAPFSDPLQHLCFLASLELATLAAVTKKPPNLSRLP